MYDGSLGKMPTSVPCEFILQSITPWVACGWTIIYEHNSRMLCPGRGKFFRSWCQPTRCQCLNAGLSDGYFVIPYNWKLLNHDQSSGIDPEGEVARETMESVKERVSQLVSAKGKRSSRSYHKELGQIMWDYAGMARNEEGLNKAIGQIQDLRDDFNKNLLVTGTGEEYNMELERSGRVRDFIDFGELLCRDALTRNESCGGHFEEFQTDDGEATRNDDDFAHAAVWEFKGDGETPARHEEDLKFEEVKLAVRSYI